MAIFITEEYGKKAKQIKDTLSKNSKKIINKNIKKTSTKKK
ncbi:MAG: hypothetical protein SPI06_07315 [Terrisporobacter sp.]|nr:hypothetical protein [Terrisporobacter sp.]MDY6153204.1 hypothetical protein [Terrisporobacter sp.]